ncbi:unnamed protein product [Urochloa decumbens]|uniref:BAG domain-containing protein n=1 Tax=Urochloa decumbens TaxID=240449 RepID=A0ABC9B348_9POAL
MRAATTLPLIVPDQIDQAAPRNQPPFQEKLQATAMASRRFFAYDPHDYYYASPYHYTYSYHQYYQQPSPYRSAGDFFPAAAPEPVTVAPPRPTVESSSRPPVSIPGHFVGSELEPERLMPAAAARPPRKRALSAEDAAVRVQAAARGFLARRSVRAVREVEREAAEAGAQIARDAAALRGDARARVAVGEALMRMLLRLDAVRGAREYRRKVTKRVLKLQDAVDALEAAPASATEGNESYVEAAAPAAEMAGESAAASEVLDGEERGGWVEAEAVAAEMAGESAAASEVLDGEERGGGVEAEAVAAEMEVDGDGADGEPEQAAQDEWEMVTEEPEAAAEQPATTCPEALRPQEQGGTEITTAAEGGAGGLDARKVMEMVAALCERSAQQCAVIGALAERVDALERAVRRVEDAERRRRRAKKLRKAGKGSNHNSKCYSSD